MELDLTEKDLWLVRDAIALALGGSARLTKKDKARLVEIAEHVLLRTALRDPNTKAPDT